MRRVFGEVTQWVYAYLKVNGDAAVAAALHLGHQGLEWVTSHFQSSVVLL